MSGCIVDEDPKFIGPKLQLLIVSKRYPYIMISTVDSLCNQELAEFSKMEDLHIGHLQKCSDGMQYLSNRDKVRV